MCSYHGGGYQNHEIHQFENQFICLAGWVSSADGLRGVHPLRNVHILQLAHHQLLQLPFLATAAHHQPRLQAKVFMAAFHCDHQPRHIHVLSKEVRCEQEHQHLLPHLYYGVYPRISDMDDYFDRQCAFVAV